MSNDANLSNRREQAVYLQSGDPTKERRLRLPANANGQEDSYWGGQKGQYFNVPDSTTGRPAGWQLVLTDSVLDVAPYDGAVAYWKDKSKFLVTTAVTNRGQGAGIFRDSDAPQQPTTHNIAVDTIVCIQKKGRVALKYESGTPDATGLFVIPGASAGTVIALGAGAAATYPSIGVSAGAINVPAANYAYTDIDFLTGDTV